MPKRYRSLTAKELLDARKALELSSAETTGSITQLRNNNTGFLAETAALSETQRAERLLGIRYEIYMRGVEGNDDLATEEPTNPYAENIRRVESRWCG